LGELPEQFCTYVACMHKLNSHMLMHYFDERRLKCTRQSSRETTEVVSIATQQTDVHCGI
jgi:uncharacterized membrane protein